MRDSVKIAANTTQNNIENTQCSKTRIRSKNGIVNASLKINSLILHLEEIKVLLK